MTLIELLLDRRKREERYFRNYLYWAKEIKKEVLKELRQASVHLFGSVIRGEIEPGSDIDILIIASECDTAQKKSRLRDKILDHIGDNTPFEIHVVTPTEFNQWYRHFIKEKQEV